MSARPRPDPGAHGGADRAALPPTGVWGLLRAALPPARVRALLLAAALAVLAAPAARELDAQERRFRIPGTGRDPMERIEDLNPAYDGRLQFVRLRFGGGGFGGFGRGGPPWMHDYPRAERNFMRILEETTRTAAVVDGSQVLAVDDPELFNHPVAYIVEVGFWNPTAAEVEALQAYLSKGGFLIVDDFRGDRELRNFEYQLDRVLPGVQLVRLEDDHPIFDAFFRIEAVSNMVPPTFQGLRPVFYGIFEDNDPEERLLGVVNFNNDIAEYWEYSDRGYYPIDLSNEAYKLGVNYVVYALTH